MGSDRTKNCWYVTKSQFTEAQVHDPYRIMEHMHLGNIEPIAHTKLKTFRHLTLIHEHTMESRVFHLEIRSKPEWERLGGNHKKTKKPKKQKKKNSHRQPIH